MGKVVSFSDEAEATLSGKEGGDRQYKGLIGILVKAIGAGGGLFFILYNAGVLSYFNISLHSNQYNAIFMAVVLTLTFLLIPASKRARRKGLPWHDLLLIFGSLAGCIYIIVNARELSYMGRISASPFEIGLGVVTFLALLEAVRRGFGWSMVIIISAFILYTKFGYLLSGPLKVYHFTWSMMASDIYLSEEGIFGFLTGLVSDIIVTFITFGVFFVATGGADFFLKLALGFTGTMRGGAAKAAIVGSALFGTISGSASANCAVTGSITIPLMKSIGLQSYYAGAVETISATGGAIMPPVMAGIAFVMAMMTGKPYSYIAMISIIPAVLYYLSVFMQVHLQATKMGIGSIPREQLPSIRQTLKEGWEFAIPFVVLLVLMFFLKYPTSIAGTYTIFSVIIISIFRKKHRLNVKSFTDSLYGGLRSTLPVGNILALAGVVLALLTTSGLGPKISAALVTIFGSNMLLLVIASGLAVYIMGLPLSEIATYILVSALVAPALMKLGLPLVVSHYFVMYMVISGGFTPPLAPTAFVAAGIAGASGFRIGWQAMRLGIVAYLVPFAIIYKPALIMMATPGEIVLATVTAIIGVISLAAGFEGYLFSPANWLQRVLFLLGGISMFVPIWIIDVCGAILVGTAAFWQWRSPRTGVTPAIAASSESSGSHRY